MRKLSLGLVLTIVLLALAGCGRNNDVTAPSLALLDRKTVINNIPKAEKPPGESESGEEVYVILDDSSSVGKYALSGTLFSDALSSGKAIFTDSDFFRGYKMSDLLVSQTDTGNDAEIPSVSSAGQFFDNAATDSGYNSDSDKSNLAVALDNLKIASGADKFAEDKLIVLISDLYLTNSDGTQLALIGLSDTMGSFINNKDGNVSIVALQSMADDNSQIAVELDTVTLAVKGLSRKINKSDINYGKQDNSGKRPVYFLFMGDTELVSKYTDEFVGSIKQSSRYNEDDVKTIILDEFPVSDEVPPPAQPLIDPIVPVLGDDFAEYALSLDANALDYVFTPSLTDTETGLDNDVYAWDSFISDGKIPIWRVWDKGLDSGSEEFSLSFTTDKGVSVDSERIAVKCFTVDTDSGKTLAEADTGNEYVNIGTVPATGTINIPLKLLQPKLTVNNPLLFLLDVTLEKELPKAEYVPVDYSEAGELAWIYDRTLTTDEYWDNCYKDFPIYDDDNKITGYRKGFWPGGGGSRKDGTSGYELHDQTWYLSDFISKLFERRQNFINEENKPRIDDSVHQYALFGFVVRQSYATERTQLGYTSKTEPGDNGGYAFSIEEIGKLKSGMKTQNISEDTDGGK
ncbi:MAG: hypothetical protein LBD85_01080 [Oscillospiraceae bacterium]|jgi:hypothetical protein|nr:hypothetical protein [Oscillospiraceae bacterium]